METFTNLADAEDYLTAAMEQVKKINTTESEMTADKKGRILLKIKQIIQEVEQAKEKEFDS